MLFNLAHPVLRNSPWLSIGISHIDPTRPTLQPAKRSGIESAKKRKSRRRGECRLPDAQGTG